MYLSFIIGGRNGNGIAVCKIFLLTRYEIIKEIFVSVGNGNRSNRRNAAVGERQIFKRIDDIGFLKALGCDGKLRIFKADADLIGIGFVICKGDVYKRQTYILYRYNNRISAVFAV